MINYIPTTHDAGVRLWGSHDEFYGFYAYSLRVQKV